MSARATHFKLGIFTVIAVLAVLAAAFGLGWRGVTSDRIRYHTYFDESVQGLELGAPVKFRGVMIGSVDGVVVAPDHQHVDVTLALDMTQVASLGLASHRPDVRAQLGTQGITGVKFIDIDLFDPVRNPPPQLPFRAAENYIPQKTSFLKGVEDDLEVVSQRLPDLVEGAVSTLERIEGILEGFDDQKLAERMAKAVENIDGAARDMRHLLRSVDGARVPDKLATAIEGLAGTIARVNELVEGIGGDGGLVASTQRATEAVGDLGRTTNGSAAKLERTLRDLDEAASAIRGLAEAIDRDPDMLVKGRAKAKGR